MISIESYYEGYYNTFKSPYKYITQSDSYKKL